VLYLDYKHINGLNKICFTSCIDFEGYPLDEIFRHVNKMAYLKSKFVRLEKQQQRFKPSRLQEEYKYEDLCIFTLKETKNFYKNEVEALTDTIKTYKSYGHAIFLKCLLHNLELPHLLKYKKR